MIMSTRYLFLKKLEHAGASFMLYERKGVPNNVVYRQTSEQYS